MSPSGSPGYPTPLDGAVPGFPGAGAATRVLDMKATVVIRVAAANLVPVLRRTPHLGRPLVRIVPPRVRLNPAARKVLFAVGAVASFVVAAVLGVMAFTRFDSAPETQDPDEVQRWNDHAYDAAFVSVALGIGCAFSLLAGFACVQGYRRPR